MQSIQEHLLLLSGYGAPDQDDMILCMVDQDGIHVISAMRHGGGPSYCCQGQNGVIYVASERSDGADITAYRICDNTLQMISQLDVPDGRALCYLLPYRNVIYGCCYENGLYFAADAALQEVLWSYQPEGAHAHWAQVNNSQLLLTDLGNSSIYRFNMYNDLPVGLPTIKVMPQASGCRQTLAVGDKTVCICELDGQFRVLDKDWEIIQTEQSSIYDSPQCWPGGACLGVDGTLYMANRGPNTISSWRPDSVGYTRHYEWKTGDWPRYLTIIPGTNWLMVACNRSGTIHAYDCATTGDCPNEIFALNLAGASSILPINN